MMDLIHQFKPMVVDSMDSETSGEQEIFDEMFSKENTKIPTFINSEYLEKRVGFSKLNTNSFLKLLVDF